MVLVSLAALARPARARARSSRSSSQGGEGGAGQHTLQHYIGYMSELVVHLRVHQVTVQKVLHIKTLVLIVFFGYDFGRIFTRMCEISSKTNID